MMGFWDLVRLELRTLLADVTAWEEVTYEDNDAAPISYAHPAQAV